MESTENDVIELVKKTGNPLYVLAYAVQGLGRIANCIRGLSKIDQIKYKYYSSWIRDIGQLRFDARKIKTKNKEIKKFFDAQEQVVIGLECQIEWILHLKLILTEGEQETK